MDILNAPVEAVTGGVSQRRLESTEKKTKMVSLPKYSVRMG